MIIQKVHSLAIKNFLFLKSNRLRCSRHHTSCGFEISHDVSTPLQHSVLVRFQADKCVARKRDTSIKVRSGHSHQYRRLREQGLRDHGPKSMALSFLFTELVDNQQVDARAQSIANPDIGEGKRVRIKPTAARLVATIVGDPNLLAGQRRIFACPGVPDWFGSRRQADIPDR